MTLNSLIINFAGLGDGLIEIPLLKNMEKVAPYLRYHHTEGIMFTDGEFMKAVNLSSCLGTVPSAWRKFNKSDWHDISAFIEANSIELIINFRNLGPTFDTGYFAFKQSGPGNLEYWDYAFNGQRAEPTSIRTQMRDLLLPKLVIDHSVNWLSLRDMLAHGAVPGATQVGINIHSGSRFKVWPYEKWRSLCCELLMRGETLKVFAGFTDTEISLATKFVNDLETRWPRQTTFIKRASLLEVLRALVDTKCLVSADSWLLHAAMGMGVKAIGLFIVTSPVTWGGDSAYFVPVKSKHLSRCEKFDAGLGICRNGYVECPLIEREGDGIEVLDVLGAMKTSAGGQ